MTRTALWRIQRVALSALFSLFGLGFSCGGPTQAKLGEAFTLEPGGQARLSGGEVLVKFVSVLEDSRCPRGEQCLAAGKARVALEAIVRGGDPAKVDLSTADGSTEMDVAGFRLVLLSLDPYPVTGRPIGAENYRVTLSVTRQ